MLRHYLLKRRHKATMRRLWVVMAGARERRALWEDVERMLKITRHLTAELEIEPELFNTITMDTLIIEEQKTMEYAT